MRVISVNLNGIRSAKRKGFFEWVSSQDADIVCVQELKAQEKDMTDDMLSSQGLKGFFSYAEKPGYSGVGVYTKEEPKSITRHTNFDQFDVEGRYIELEFKHLSIISSYFPSGSSGEVRQNFKFRCLEYLEGFLKNKIQSRKNFILTGDLNIAHKEIDLKNDKGNKKNSGFLPEEREWIELMLTSGGWTDAYRKIHPDEESMAYTWWSNRGQAWANNVGWRIDYQLVTKELAGKILKSWVYKDNRFSDHAPLIVDYDFSL